MLTPSLRTLGHFAIAVLVVLMVWTPLSRTLVGAASSSTPGQALYPLKIHVERAQITGASQPDVRVALALAFLGERVAEIQVLVGRDGRVPESTVAEVQVLVNLLLQSVAETPDSTLTDALRYAALQLNAYLDALEATRSIATPTEAQTIGAIEQACKRGYLVIGRALSEPTEFAAAYRAGRPELFLLPGESPLSGVSELSDSVTNIEEERSHAQIP